MSNNTPGPEFWNRVNVLINLANDQCDSADPGEVGASIMYASARFNAFLVARKMMEDNLDDFIANHANYLGSESQ